MYVGLFLSFFGLASCDVSDDEVPCITGPVQLYLEFVEKQTGENLYANDTFQTATLEVTDEDGVLVPFEFVQDLNRTFLKLTFEREVGEKLITLAIKEDVSLDLELTIAVLEDSCRSYYISEFEVPGYEYDQGGVAGVVRILF
ncbi:hypothetical protein DHB64_10925 [Antarcticibacterium sp. W02-3]|nr:hypothetical protein [Antarcticibacterium sp. W02-3]